MWPFHPCGTFSPFTEVCILSNVAYLPYTLSSIYVLWMLTIHRGLRQVTVWNKIIPFIPIGIVENDSISGVFVGMYFFFLFQFFFLKIQVQMLKQIVLLFAGGSLYPNGSFLAVWFVSFWWSMASHTRWWHQLRLIYIKNIPVEPHYSKRLK